MRQRPVYWDGCLSVSLGLVSFVLRIGSFQIKRDGLLGFLPLDHGCVVFALALDIFDRLSLGFVDPATHLVVQARWDATATAVGVVRRKDAVVPGGRVFCAAILEHCVVKALADGLES